MKEVRILHPLGGCSGLRRIGGGPQQTSTNNGGVASEDDDMEDNKWKTTTSGWEVEDCR